EEIRRAGVVTDMTDAPSGGPSCDRRALRGPFDVIGDVHGCASELVALLERLGYRRASSRAPFRHPDGRRAVFVGDLVDRGPQIVRALRIAVRVAGAGPGAVPPRHHAAPPPRT